MAKSKTIVDKVIDSAGGAVVRASTLPAPFVRGMTVPPLGAPLDQCPTSLDLSTEAGQVKAFNAMNAGDCTFGSNGAVEMELSDWLVYPDEGPNEQTGEVSQFVRVVLIDQAGRTFRTTSEAVFRALDRLIAYKRQHHFDPPVPITVAERRSQKTGHTYHELRLRMASAGGGK